MKKTRGRKSRVRVPLMVSVCHTIPLKLIKIPTTESVVQKYYTDLIIGSFAKTKQTFIAANIFIFTTAP
jgi:hypothetical protein